MAALRSVAMCRLGAAVAVALLLGGCGFGPSTDFTLSNAAVDSAHACASAASYVAYDVHATVDGHNSKSSAVSISSMSAVMTLAAVHGGWLQPVGYRYVAGNVTFTPDRVGAGSSATLQVTIPSACTNLSKSAGPVSYGDYSVALTVNTSAGTFKIETKNRHRIIGS
jgi:hypothetical protein